MNKTTTETYIWTVVADHTEAGTGRRGYGMGLREAQQTAESFNAVIGRTIFLRRNIMRSQIEKPVKWVSFSDDGDITYSGVINADALMGKIATEDDDDLGYHVDRFNMEDAGAVIVLYCPSDLAKHGYPEFVTNHPKNGRTDGDLSRFPDWLPLYG